jgi:predicted glycosyltransferase
MTERPQLAISTTGTSGDVVQLIEIGHALVQRDVDVTFVSHETYRGLAEEAGLHHAAIDTVDEHQRLIAASEALIDHQYDLAAVNAATSWYYVPDRWRQEAAAVTTALGGTGPRAFIGRFASSGAGLRAAQAVHAQTLWAVLWPAMLTDIVLSPLTNAEHTAHLGRVCDALGLTPPSDWRRWIQGVPALGLWPAWFGAVEAVLDHLELTGFVPADHLETGRVPSDVRDFLADGDPPVLITGGSGRMVPSDFYTAALEGARRLGRRVLIVTPRRDLLPDQLPPDTVWASQAPFATLFPHVGAAIHHGGISTCTRALSAGVAQVILAAGVDRPDNGERLTQLGVAQCLLRRQWSPDRVAAALTTALAQEPARREIAARVVRERGAAVAAEHVLRVLGEA